MKEQFKESQIKMGRDKLFRLLAKEGLLISKRRRCTAPNLPKCLHLYRPEKRWVADIAYLEMMDGNSYLHLISDAYPK